MMGERSHQCQSYVIPSVPKLCDPISAKVMCATRQYVNKQLPGLPSLVGKDATVFALMDSLFGSMQQLLVAG
jgi:hypothetical protein